MLWGVLLKYLSQKCDLLSDGQTDGQSYQFSAVHFSYLEGRDDRPLSLNVVDTLDILRVEDMNYRGASNVLPDYGTI